MDKAAWAPKFDALTAGTAQPTNPLSTYAVEQLRNARAQYHQAKQQLQVLEDQSKQLRDTVLRLEGVCSQCCDDIVHWEEQVDAVPEGSVPPAQPLSSAPKEQEKPKPARGRKAAAKAEDAAPLLPGLPAGDASADN